MNRPEPLTFDALFNRYLQQLEVAQLLAARPLRTLAVLLPSVRRVSGREQNHRRSAPSPAATLQDFQRWLFYQPTSRGTARTVSIAEPRPERRQRLFSRSCASEGYLAHNPAQGLRLAREPDTLPSNVLTPEEARKIIEAPDTHTLSGYRDRAILEVLYATGIRKAELRNLTVADVNLEEELLRVNRGKGAKTGSCR